MPTPRVPARVCVCVCVCVCLQHILIPEDHGADSVSGLGHHATDPGSMYGISTLRPFQGGKWVYDQMPGKDT